MRKKETLKKFFMTVVTAVILSIVMPHVPFQPVNILVAEAAPKIKLNKTALTLKSGNTYKLKLSGTTKHVVWKSSNKKIVTVNSNGKITAKKAETVTITAKVGPIKLLREPEYTDHGVQ